MEISSAGDGTGQAAPAVRSVPLPPARTNGPAAGRNRPRITVIGTGYVGAAQAACLAGLGFEVLGVDTDPARVKSLCRGEPGIYEPGLSDLLRSGLSGGRLSFTTSYAAAARFGDVHFLCVGTPQRAGAAGAELSHLYACVDSLAPLLRRGCLVVGKSTVPVGTAAQLARRLAGRAPAGKGAELAWNPEFLREGRAVADSLHPDRIVIGVSSARAEQVLRQVYAAALADGVPLVVTDLATAELAKQAANSFLATKISFINAMAELCETTGADVTRLAETLGYDSRIGPGGLAPGLGFGGACLPKDIRAFAERARELGVTRAAGLLQDVDEINLARRQRMLALARLLTGGTLAGRRIGVLGLAFKPGSDDIRDSPALAVATALCDQGATVTAYDPAAMAKAARACPRLRCAPSATEAARGADALLLLTDWPEFAGADPAALGEVVAARNIADGRNLLDPSHWQAAGWRYLGLGRPAGQIRAATGPALLRARAAAAMTSAGVMAASTGSVRSP